MAEPSFASDALDVLIPWLREHGPVEVMTFGTDRERAGRLLGFLLRRAGVDEAALGRVLRALGR